MVHSLSVASSSATCCYNWRGRFLAGLLFGWVGTLSAAPVHEVISSFHLPPAQPITSLARAPDGMLWGVTQQGGAWNYGTVFKVNPGTGALTTLAQFSGEADGNRGASPSAALVEGGDGFFWGTTLSRGTYGGGTVFKINQITGDLATVIEFTKNGAVNKGQLTFAALVRGPDGMLWGSTTMGGTFGHGTVFKINRQTGVLTTVVEFSGNGAVNKGANPYAALTDAGQGFFWGSTRGGGSGDIGTIFKINQATGALTTVIEFTNDGTSNRGGWPYAALVGDGMGFLWGSTYSGGASGFGTLFKIHPVTGVLTTVLELSPSETGGAHGLFAELVPDGQGSFWGCTYSGGLRSYGTIFKLDPLTGIRTTVANLPVNNQLMGYLPRGGLVGDGGDFFYGMTTKGGIGDRGTVFKIHRTTYGVTNVTGFTDGGVSKKGVSPAGTLTGDGWGYLWGTTEWGGAADVGTVFKINEITGEKTTVVEFERTGAVNQGIYPKAGLVSDGGDFLWGTTAGGDPAFAGSVYKVNRHNGALITVFSGRELLNCRAPLVPDAAGFFWGTTAEGGYLDAGTIFKINQTTGEFRVVLAFTFNGPVDRGGYPRGALIHDGAGSLWGTCSKGGLSDNKGTIFKIDRNTGILTTVVDFTGNGGVNKGSTPYAALTYDGEGSFWGTTREGGQFNRGTVFKVHRGTGVLSTVSEFGGTVLGGLPVAGLTDDGQEAFWGMSQGQGGWDGLDLGTVFRIDRRTATVTTVLTFTGVGSQPDAGQVPVSSLLMHTDGNLYGTTPSGGAGGGGNVFRLRLEPLPPAEGRIDSLRHPIPGQAELRFTGLRGQRYHIERALSPAGPWTSEGFMTAPPNGRFSFNDSTAPPNRAFYRLRPVP